MIFTITTFEKTRLPVFFCRAFLQQCGVAQIVSHHDGGVQGGEIQSGNRNAVIPTQRIRWRWKDV